MGEGRGGRDREVGGNSNESLSSFDFHGKTDLQSLMGGKSILIADDSAASVKMVRADVANFPPVTLVTFTSANICNFAVLCWPPFLLPR